MSDFFYSSLPASQKNMDACFDAIYSTNVPQVRQFHGPWGSLGVSLSHYNGFDPIETDRHICAVLGGPVLGFHDNDFLSGADSQAGTRIIFERWQLGEMKWDEDLSGPFVVLIIDKVDFKVTCITDLMLFIPVYQYEDDACVALGSHTDALANLCHQYRQLDEVSVVDFVLHGAVTFPYTIYREIRQCYPASEHSYTLNEGDGRLKPESSNAYWIPTEECPYKTVSEAAMELRQGVAEYIERITGSMTNVAQFISGGEDSRVLSGLLPSRLKRDAYIFLDNMNREGRIAKKIASAYGVNFVCSFRDVNHYLTIMDDASSLIGSGHQFIHAHPLGFHQQHHLDKYSAVFGGYLSDSLLKGQFARKLRSAKFVPQIALNGEARTKALVNPLFSDRVLAVLDQRRQAHLNQVTKFRPRSAHEWFELWPITMREAAPNLYCNRRLFASYEVFTSKEVVKIAASVPIQWKLNRRLFNKAFRVYLRNTKWYRHADGRLPYFPWWVNCPIQCGVWTLRKVSTKLGFSKIHQGPWASWKDVMVSSEWHSAVASVTGHPQTIEEVESAVRHGAFSGAGLTTLQKLNLLQVCSFMSKVREEHEQPIAKSAKAESFEDRDAMHDCCYEKA